MADRLELLPRPRELRLEAGALHFDALPAIHVRAGRPDQAERARERVRTCLGRDAGLRAVEPGADAPAIELEIDPALGVPAEGFELSIGSRGVGIRARDPRGLNWGAGLLVQIVRQSGGELPCLRARDWPDFACSIDFV